MEISHFLSDILNVITGFCRCQMRTFFHSVLWNEELCQNGIPNFSVSILFIKSNSPLILNMIITKFMNFLLSLYYHLSTTQTIYI